MTGSRERAGNHVSVREATVPDLPDVLNVLDGAALAVDAARLRSGIDRGDVLVAAAGGDAGAQSDAQSTRSEPERVLGALVLDGEEITAIAVRRRRRGQGIGTRLVEAAADRHERLVAEFDPRVRPFWASLDFDVDVAGDGRYRGVRQ